MTIRRPSRATDVRIRLARRVEQQGDCLVYTGGYPQRSGHKRIWHGDRMASVHRVAYELVHGPIPPGMVVRHRCDNPPCVRIDHLLIGTVADNNRDRDDRGRHRVLNGSQNGNARLAEWKVAEIKARLVAGEPQLAIAKAYGCGQSTISLINQGVIWARVKPAEQVAA